MINKQIREFYSGLQNVTWYKGGARWKYWNVEKMGRTEWWRKTFERKTDRIFSLKLYWFGTFFFNLWSLWLACYKPSTIIFNLIIMFCFFFILNLCKHSTGQQSVQQPDNQMRKRAFLVAYLVLDVFIYPEYFLMLVLFFYHCRLFLGKSLEEIATLLAPANHHLYHGLPKCITKFCALKTCWHCLFHYELFFKNYCWR